MHSIALFFETKKGKYIKNFLMGVGASLVLLGALFKLQHWPGAGVMLSIGMFTEVFLFAFIGILPPHKDYYWERYYPNLDENPEIEAYQKSGKTQVNAAIPGFAGGSNSTAALDKMLDEANMDPANIKRLGENFAKFNTAVSQMRDVTEVTAATGEFSNSAKAAAVELTKLKDTYAGAVSTMTSFNEASESTAQFHNQVQVLSKNLGTLNQIYEIELQDANNHLKAMNKFYSNLVNASEAMASSADDAQAAKEQIAALSKNLTSLNNIYGNMLSAMQGR